MNPYQGANPAIDLPLSPVPHTLVASIPGYVYYFEFPSEPSPDEYQAGVIALGNRMAKDLGLVITSKDILYRPSAEIRWGEIHGALKSEPVKVT